eukprot:TRINITY_DN15029_c0_g1_i1.p1 TRINITY_DN15029_c0_g1~~TRINITY_DN15029_c0_g1_i1.p1  ORF type:complete len:311 (+),score=55.64 TRINITY_DN15029_c0_g1_i1:117-1049(+)
MDKAGSKICARRVREKEQEMHRDRIKNMKSQVDTRVPTVAMFDHIKVNLKKEQMMEDRYSEIDRDNRILLKKMTEIMKQQTTYPATNRASSRASSTGPVSLNRDARKKELLRITRENQSILKRIQQAQPVYNHVEWEDEHRRNAGYLKNRCEFPVVLRTPRTGKYATSELRNVGHEDEGSFTARSAPVGGKAVQPDLDDGANQKFVLKEGMKLSETYYLVDMTTDGRNLFVSAYDNNTGTTLELVVKERIHRRLYRESNGDYRKIASRLQVSTQGQLLLDGEEDRASPGPQEMDAASMVARANNGAYTAR